MTEQQQQEEKKKLHPLCTEDGTPRIVIPDTFFFENMPPLHKVNVLVNFDTGFVFRITGHIIVGPLVIRGQEQYIPHQFQIDVDEAQELYPSEVERIKDAALARAKEEHAKMFDEATKAMAEREEQVKKNDKKVGLNLIGNDGRPLNLNRG